MKLSEYQGEAALDILAELIEPAGEIMSDKHLGEVFKDKGDGAVHWNRFGHLGGKAAADGCIRRDQKNRIKRISAVFSPSGLVGAKTGRLVCTDDGRFKGTSDRL